MTLTEFLLARNAEDEAACGPEDNSGYCDWLEGIHHTRARVLAECEAKRRIIAEHEAAGVDCRTCGVAGEHGVDFPCPTLRLLALPYADHPDYRDEWRP